MFGDLKKYDYFCGNLVKMAGNLQQRLDSLRSKSQLLTERYVKLKTEKQAADATIAELTEELRRAKPEITAGHRQMHQRTNGMML